MDALSVTVNTAQTRVKRDRLATLVSGEDWRYANSSNVYIEPLELTAMLMPQPFTTDWYTSGSRYGIADYTYATGSSSNWVQDANTPTDIYIKGIASSGDNSELITTKAVQPNNGSMWLSWFGANAGADDMIQIECGWATPATAPISLRFYAGGKVDVYRNQLYQDTYNINGPQQTQAPQQTASTYVSVCIMPFRGREILVISNRGGAFIHRFDDIASAANPTITPAAPFWWTVPTGAAKVACAPCLFATSGYICGATSYFVKPPEVGTTATPITYQAYNGGSVTAHLTSATDPTTAFVPDGTTTTALVRVDLSGNGVTTPNLYGAHVYFDPITAQTPSTPVVLDQWLTKAKLAVPDNATELKWEFEFKSPAAIAAAVPSFSVVSNRPYRIQIGALTAFGVSEPAKRTLGVDDTSSRVSVEVRDKWKLCEQYLFSDPTPLDGLALSAAFRLILSSVGISEVDIEESGFTLPSSDTPSKNDFAVLIKAGDSAADWLTRLHENYCSTWFMGFCPATNGWTFRVVSPATLGTTSVMTLYSSVADAMNSGLGIDFTNYPQFVYRSYDEHSLEPEANAIYVTGRDQRTGYPIMAYKEDSASQDPTTAVSTQPDNWLGCVRKYGLVDSSICGQAAVTQCVNILYDRLTRRRIVAEFTSDFLIKPNGLPVWRGDVITLEGLGDYRVKSFSCDYETEPDNSSQSWFWRPTKYVVEKVSAGVSGLTSLYGYSLAQVVGSHKLRSRSKRIIRQDRLSQQLPNYKPLQVFVV